MRLLSKTIALAGVVAVTASCSDLLFDDPDHIYNGPPVVEFAPVMPAGNYVRSVSFAADSQESTTVNVRVHYIAPPPESSVSGQISVAGGSTAVEGQHFAFPDGSSFTIAAGQNFTDVRVQLMGGGLAPGQSVSLFMELMEGQGYEVSANYKNFEIRASKGS